MSKGNGSATCLSFLLVACYLMNSLVMCQKLFAEILKKKTRDNLIAFNCCNLSGSL